MSSRVGYTHSKDGVTSPAAIKEPCLEKATTLILGAICSCALLADDKSEALDIHCYRLYGMLDVVVGITCIQCCLERVPVILSGPKK